MGCVSWEWRLGSQPRCRTPQKLVDLLLCERFGGFTDSHDQLHRQFQFLQELSVDQINVECVGHLASAPERSTALSSALAACSMMSGSPAGSCSTHSVTARITVPAGTAGNSAANLSATALHSPSTDRSSLPSDH